MHKSEIVINFGNGKIERIEKAITDAQYLDVINRLHKDGYELIETNTVVTVQQSSGIRYYYFKTKLYDYEMDRYHRFKFN